MTKPMTRWQQCQNNKTNAPMTTTIVHDKTDAPSTPTRHQQTRPMHAPQYRCTHDYTDARKQGVMQFTTEQMDPRQHQCTYWKPTHPLKHRRTGDKTDGPHNKTNVPTTTMCRQHDALTTMMLRRQRCDCNDDRTFEKMTELMGLIHC